jgi:hypothetical protein
MTARALLGSLIIAALASSGCAAAYTDIRKVDDAHYIVTRTKQGFMRTYGSVYYCTARSELALDCEEIDTP